MKILYKVLIGIILSFMCIFSCIGYASVSENLSVIGEIEVDHPVYDTIVITDVEAITNTSVSEIHSIVIPTNIKTTVSGNSGGQIIYKITAHNYSETDTFVFTGVKYDDGYQSVANSLTIATYSDEEYTEVVPAKKGTNFAEGVAVAPGEEITIYAKYTLKSNITSSDILVNFEFKKVIYSVTYMNNNELYYNDHIFDNSVAYTVREDLPDDGGLKFADWINVAAQPVQQYPAGNTNSYTLSAKWDNVYIIIFSDEKGNVLYQESFTSSSTSLSPEGQATVDAIIAELAANVADDELTVAWSDYQIKGSKSDINVRAIYTYHGKLKYTPVDTENDGIIDYYKLEAVNALDGVTEILGSLNGIDVEVIEKLYKNEGNFDFGSGVQTIIMNEGTKHLMHNSLAYTSDLSTVYLPNSITQIDKNVFSRNTGDDRKKLTIYYNGTKAEWDAISKHEDWQNGLLTGSRVICSDGYYEVERKYYVIYEKYTWTFYPN